MTRSKMGHILENSSSFIFYAFNGTPSGDTEEVAMATIENSIRQLDMGRGTEL